MKLYYFPGACSLGDHIVLEWLGTPFELKRVEQEDRAQPEYRKLNPAGSVPVLEHDGWALTQNVAILDYLMQTHPNAGLTGDGSAKSHAEVMRWLAFFNADVHPSFRPLFGSTAYLEDATAIAKTQQHARKQLRTLFERTNAQLEGRDYIAGPRSIADPYLFVMLRWADALKLDMQGLEHLAAFKQRMLADSGVQRALKAEGIA